MLSSVSPTHTTSDTALPNGAFVVLPVSVSRKYQVVAAFAVVQLYLVSENSARSYHVRAWKGYLGSCVHTPLALRIPVLRRGAASIPSVVMARAESSSRPKASIADFIAIVNQSVFHHALPRKPENDALR
jgi:hypothetical protein